MWFSQITVRELFLLSNNNKQDINFVSKMSFKSKFLTIVVLVFTSCAPITTRQTSNYKEVIAKYNTMVLLPVEVEINSVDAGGKNKKVL